MAASGGDFAGVFVLPASFAQARLWFLHRLEPDSPTYNIPFAFRLRGELVLPALARSLWALAERHEPLRTTLAVENDEPVQVVAPPAPVPLPVVDLAGLPGERREAELERRLAAEAGRPFDLERGPLLRAAALRLAPEEHVLALALHHAVADGWSLGVLARELSVCYGAFRAGAEPALGELPIQYADYAAWQRERLTGAALEELLGFWRETLGDAPPVLDLPFARSGARSRPVARSDRGDRRVRRLDGAAFEALERLARERGATRFMAWLALFGLALHRLAPWSGRSDVIVGTPVAGRPLEETEGLIGLFVNTLVLRLDLAGEPTVAELLDRARDVCVAAFGHQELPFERLVEELAPGRELGREPLVQAILVLRDEPAGQAPSLPGVDVEALELGTGTVKFELALSLPAAGRAAAAYLDFSADLFEPADAARLLESLEALLLGAVAGPERRIGELPLLVPAARHQLLYEWNDTAVVYPRERSIPELFREVAARRPEAVAVSQGALWWSYGELDRRSDRLAARLAAAGVGPEALVGLVGERSPELVAGLVAILKAGGAYLPLDASYPAERLVFMLEDGEVPVLVASAASLDRLPAAALARRGTRVVGLEEGLAGRSQKEPEGEAPAPAGRSRPGSLAYVLYTSGSTGRPKGVAVEHRSVVRLVREADYASLGEEETLFQLAPVPFDASTLEIWGALLNGGRLEIPPPGASSLAELGRQVEAARVTTLWLTAGLFHQMVEQELPRLAGVRQLLAGGDVLSVPHVERVRRALAAGQVLVNGYGPTEGTTFTCCHRMGSAERMEREPVPIGRPIASTRVYLLDERLEPVPAGVPGELYLGGDGVARGYLARPALTAAAFVPDPFREEAGRRLYRTGDLARWLPGGEVEFLGRIDGQVKLRGFRIELGEIESVLASHPAVAQAAVAVREDRPGDRRLVAYTVAADGAPAVPAALRAHLAETLPDFMVPVAFVTLPELPLDPNGKVDRKALPAPEADASTETTERVLPRGPLEELVAAAWSEVLGVSAVGAHEDFFDLGGHSLLATRVVSRLRELAGVEVPLRRLFERPTVAELAGVVEQLRRSGAAGERPPLVRRAEREQAASASFAQERLWFLDQLEGRGSAYLVAGGQRLRGPLDLPSLAGALEREVARHEALRTRFESRGGDLVQVVEPWGPRPLPAVIDLSALAPHTRRREAEALARRASTRPFDLARGPVFRAFLLREGDGEHRLLLAVHHIAFDGWSLGVLWRELAESYGALRVGRRPALAELPLQYADYAAWQRAWLDGDALEEQLAWWRERLAGAAEVLELPADRPRPAERGPAGGRIAVALSPELAAGLRALARERGATLYLALLAGFAALLSRLSGSRDLVVGTPVAGRAHPALEGLVGFFVNTLALRADLGGQPGLAELVGRLRETALGAWDHQDLPFERLVQELAPERTLGHSPLVQVVFALQNAAPELPGLPGLETEPIALPTASAKFDLTLVLREEADGGLRGELEYARDLFDATTARRWAGLFEALLEAGRAAPERPVAGLPWLRRSERQQLLSEWNDTAVAYPRERSIPELFREVAARRPEAVAVAQGERCWSYRELDRRSDRLAARLIAVGVGPEALVGLAAERSPELVAGLLAILKAGGAYLPLDASYPAERLAFMLEDGEVPVLVASAASLARGPAAALARTRVVGLEDRPREDGEPAAPPAGRSGPGSLAYVLYTSGSTGRPKGVAVEHRSVVRLVRGADYAALNEEETLLQLAPVPFDASTLEIWGALLNGGRLEIPPPGAPSLAELGRAVEARRVTTLWLTAGLFHQMVEQELPRLAGVRQLLAGGDVLSLPHVERVRGGLAAGQVLVNGYGPTEGTTFTCCHRMGPAEQMEREPVPIGRPIASTRVYLLDERLEPVPAGVPGELYLGGAGVARGYLARPALTAAAFVPSPFEEYELGARQLPPGGVRGGRLYRTGDLARWLPGGEVEFLGRIDGQVKLRGFRIELGEIESVLAAHPAVAQAAVAVREDRPGDRRLVAYAVPADGEAIEPAALRAHLAERLPDYMVPGAFVPLAELPLDPNGKLDRRALPAPEAAAVVAEAAEWVLPRGPLEELVAAAWSEVLGVSAVGAHEDFFDLGGHSLLATRVVSRLRELAGVEVPLRRLFERPTVAELAGIIEELRRGAAAPERPPLVRRADSDQPAPASFAQERLWFLDQLEGPGSAYVVAGGLRLAGELSPPALAGALARLAGRHEALRTRFQPRNPPRPGASQVVQVVDPAPPQALPVADLSGLPPGRREAALTRLGRRDAIRPFDLARGPLFRGLLVRCREREHVLLLAVHHAVFDGWSLGVLLRELARLYGALVAGRPPALPELLVQYGDYAAWQRGWLAGGAVEGQIAWWRERLTGAPAVLELPADRPRPAVQSYRGGSERLRFPAELSDSLQALARGHGATLFTVLLSGFTALLSRLTGGEDLAVGTPVAGRSHPGLEGLIGLFVNTVVLRLDLGGDPSFAELLGRARETTLEAWDRQDLPFERLVEALAPERALSHSPLFQVMLVLQNTPSAPPELAGLEVEPYRPELSAARLDLTLGLTEDGGEIRGDAEYNRDLFDPTTVARLGASLRALLEDAVARPQARLSELALLPPACRHQVLVEWNDLAVPASGLETELDTLHLWIEAQAERTPERIALVAGRERWSYRELIRRAGRLAGHLRGLGLVPEERVGICLDRSPDMVAALLAVLEAGGAYVALDPAYPLERLAVILDDAGRGSTAGSNGAAVEAALPRVLTRERFLARLPQAARARAVDLDRFDWQAPAGVQPKCPAGGPAPESLAYLLYTSGSTGKPKGVAVEHRSAAALLAWARDAFGPEELSGVLAATSINFDLSVFELFVPLAAGGTVVLAADALALAELDEAPRVTLVNTVPSAMTELVRMGALPASVRTVNLAGEPLKRSLADEVLAAARVERLYNLYGPSEDTTYSTWAAVPAGDRAEPTIGRPVSGTGAYVLDPRLRPAAPGAVGELCLAGRGLARGYLARPAQTAERFVPDPLSGEPGGRLYRTGDLVRWLPGGELRFLGRMDHQVKLRGFRIELGEVESALLALPEVREAVVLAREDSPGDRRLVAYAVAEEGAALDGEALRRALARTLPGFMVPAAVVVLDDLPLTPNRKVDRKALPPPEGAPGWVGAATAASTEAAPPRDALEEVLAGLWAEVLGVPAVGIRDGFFALGGHSLLATRAVARIRDTLGVELPLRRLFEHPTIEGLAEILRAAGPRAAEEPIVPAPRDGDLPPSFAQERLWFLDRLDPGTTAYNIPALFRLAGELRPALLARALSEVVRRHEALRTVFVEEDGRPRQRVLPAPPAALPAIDLSGLPAEAAEAEAARLADRSAHRSFDLAAGPLWSAWLLRLSAREHRLAWCVHHVAADGWSLGVLLRELTALYDAWSRGRSSPLAEPPIQYADFGRWQRRSLETGALAEQVEHWRRRLADAPRALELPADRPRPRSQSHRGGRETLLVPPELLRRLRALAAGENATLFMVLLAALGTVLGRWSGQRDLVVGAPVAGRARSEVEGLIGMFLNTLALRLDLSGPAAGGPTFRELLGRAREAAVDAYAHQDVQFERLLEALEVERDLSRTPLFQVFLNVLNFPRSRVPLEGLEVELVDSGVRVESKFDLTLYASEVDGGLALQLVYAADLFEPPRMAELLDQLHGLLAQAADDPDRSIDDYSLRTPAAAARLPDPTAPLSESWQGAVHELFLKRAAEVPDRVAVTEGGAAWSYGVLARAADRLARELAAAGVGRGDRVAVLAGRSAALPAALLGVLRAGAAFVILDPAHPPRPLARVVERARPRAFLRLAEGPLPDALEAAVARLRPRLDLDFALDDGWRGTPGRAAESGREAPEPAPVPVGADDVAYVAYTSGSTGEPKGIVGRHGPLSHFIPWRLRALDLGPDDRYSLLSGLGHDPLHRDLFVPLATGGAVAVPDPERLADPGWLAAWLARERVTVAHLTPAMGHLVSSAPTDAPPVGLPDLRRALFVGEVLRRGDLRRLAGLAPGARFFNHYGTTETQQALGVQEADPEAGPADEVVPLGEGAGAVQLLVLGPSGTPAGVGELGEIVFRGPHLALGYLDDPARTAERFVPDPFGERPGARLYRTGDLGRYRPDGAVAFAGRFDHQVQVRGFRVELGAVEAALAEHPGLVAAAVVVGAGPGGARLTAFFVVSAGAGAPGADALRAHLLERLPDYAVPSAFVTLPALPRSPNGKVDRRSLAELAEGGAAPAPAEREGAPEAPAAGAATERELPPTPVEEVLAGIWREVLEVERVGRHDDFFRLGGHSLLATQVVARVRGALGVELRVRDLFERPALGGLASRIAELRAERSEGPDGAGRVLDLQSAVRTAPLSFAQERLWFLEQLGAGGAAYNMPIALELRGRLEAPALAAALGELARRHEALRTRFESLRGEPRQVILPAAEAWLPLPLADLSGLGEQAAGREARRLAGREAARPFDLGRSPLARARLLRLAPERHAVVVTLHHIVGDGWSSSLLLGELAVLYGAFRAGEPSPLAPLRLQYADFVRRQRRELTEERLAGELEHWRRRLAGAPAVLDLPFDRPRPRLQSYRGARHWLSVPDELAAGLEGLAREHRVTLFMALLAGLQALLRRVTSGQSPPIGSPIAGRGRVESEGVIGFFANTLVLYADLADDPPFVELLARAREAVLDAHDHQDLPFEKLVEALQPERNLSHSPLFQVMLVLQNTRGAPAVFPGLEPRPLRVPARTARFDLILIAGEERGRLEAKVEYNRDLFDPTTVARLTAHLVTLLRAAVERPGTRLSELPLLTAAERHHLLREWNDTRSPFPRGLLHEGFAEWAARAPDAVALEYVSSYGPGRMTYGELAARAGRLARSLAALGVRPGSRLGVFLGRGPEMVTAVLATLEAGGAYVPLEGRWPADRLRFVIEVEGIRHLLTEASGLPRALEIAGAPLEHLVCLDEPGPAPLPDGVRIWSPSALEALEGPPPVPAGAEDLAYVIFTSGSTGRPKGVMVRHRPAVNLVGWVNSTHGVGPGDRLLFVTALSFDLSVYDLLGVLAAGATVRIASAEEVLDPQRQARILLEEPITFWDSAPATLQQVAPWLPQPGSVSAAPGAAPALRLAFLSGDWIPITLPDRLRASFPGARVIALGGATEATVWSNHYPVGEVDPAWPSIPYGRPIANARYHVLDERLEPCPVGVAGDLYIAGGCLSDGYSGTPAQTAASYLPDPFAEPDRPGAVLYRTGDRARYLADGNLEFLGRLDSQVKLRGFRIELGEIEAVLAAHPGVAEAVALVREDSPGDRRLVAYYLPGEPPAGEDELRRLAREKLPDYMVPAAFVARESWPLSATGKLDRKALPPPEAAREAAAAEEGAFAPPASELERSIAALWSDVLGVERVGREETFFDLGGHSLALARVQARLQEDLGRPVAMVDLFAHPTVRSLARHLAPEPAAAPPASGGAELEAASAVLPALPAPAPAAPRGAEEALPERAVAVVGLAGRFPGAKSVERFWRNLRAGVESVRRFSDEELLAAGFPPELLADPKLVRAHGVLDDPDLFDAAFFGYSPREAQVIDPQQRLFLEVAWEALESAGYGAEDGRGSVGVFAGVSENSYVREIHRRPELVRAIGPHQISISNNADYLPTRVSYKLGLDGPSVAVQTACSTSLVAVHLACLSLQAGECDLAIAGGAAVRAREVHPYRYEEGGTASPDGRLRAFDARAGGLVGGSGVGAVVLKRLSAALADGDTIHAVIRGTAINNDGAHRIGFTAPGVEGQAAAIRAALRAAEVAPATVGYVEAHGTATALGDPIEVAALTRAFTGGGAERRQWCALGSVKTNVGHLDAAAGVTGLIKAVLTLEHAEIPPSLHFERPNPQIDFAASPFFVNTRLRPWEVDGEPRRAGVSSFGLGGTNAHAVLEEAPRSEEGSGPDRDRPAGEAAGEAPPERSAELLVLSARTEAALERATENLAGHLAEHPELSLGDAAWTLQVGRRAFPWRRAVVASGREAAAEALTERDRRRERSGLAPEEPPRLAFLFPGQGAQYPGMGEPLYREEPVFREALDRCAEVLAPELGLDLRGVLYPDVDPARGDRDEAAADRLAATELTQPALFAVEYALARLWQSWGVEPAAMVGHSIGEYVAATLAGVFAIEDALRLVAARGRLMAALPAGAMLAVRLPEDDLAARLAEVDGVALAAVNGPDACVASGPADAVAAFAERLAAEGVEARPLHTSHAFHSPMMEPAVEPFRELVARVERRPPAVPFASNVTGAWITAEEATDPGYWARHLRAPVRFGAGLAALVGSAEAAAEWALVEVGPGRALATLARRNPIAAEARAIVHSLRHPRQGGSDAERLLAALGALWVAGLPVDWRRHHGGRRRRRVPLPTYPFERRSHWLDGLPMVARSPDRPAEDAPEAGAAGRERPALSPAEARIAEVWRDVLGVEEPAPGDDFFELGGTSLMAVQLGGRMREALGVELPADFLLQASTLGEQAALAEEAGARAASGEPSGPAPPPSCLVRLQRGADGQPPLFAVHQVGGHVYSFRALAKALGPEQPVYGLRSRGLEPGEGEPLRGVEAMAEHYLDLVREAQPAGPYRLAGASMGGMVALEMAHRLREAGEEVALVAVMDTPCGDQMPRRPQEPAEFTALIFAGVGLPLTYDELRALDPDAQLAHALEKAREKGAVGPDFDLDQARRLRAVLEANVEALYEYRPRPYSGPLVLFRAEERRNQDSARPELAWVELAHGGLDFVVVPGNHATMHEPPGVQAMADDLRRRLAGC